MLGGGPHKARESSHSDVERATRAKQARGRRAAVLCCARGLPLNFKRCRTILTLVPRAPIKISFPRKLRLPCGAVTAVLKRTSPALPIGAKKIRTTSAQAHGPRAVYWQIAPRRYRLYWSDAGTFDLDTQAGRVAIYPERGATASAVEEVMRGPAGSFTLIDHGFEPLHASCVLWRGRCVAFAGVSGAGKSSLCAYFCRKGAKLMADDVLPLRYRGGRVQAHPGGKTIRITAKSARALGMNPPAAGEEKATRAMAGALHARELAAIYVLKRRAAARGVVRRQALNPAAAFRVLASLTTNFSHTTPARMANQIRTLGWLAENVPVFSLEYPSRFSAWEEIAELVGDNAVPAPQKKPLLHTQKGL